MVSLEKKIREQDVDVKTVCFGERTARKLHNEGRDTKLLGEVEKQRVIATELVLKELRGVAQKIRKMSVVLPHLVATSRRDQIRNRDYIQGLQRGFEQAKDRFLGLLVDEEEK